MDANGKNSWIRRTSDGRAVWEFAAVIAAEYRTDLAHLPLAERAAAVHLSEERYLRVLRSKRGRFEAGKQALFWRHLWGDRCWVVLAAGMEHPDPVIRGQSATGYLRLQMEMRRLEAYERHIVEADRDTRKGVGQVMAWLREASDGQGADAGRGATDDRAPGESSDLAEPEDGLADGLVPAGRAGGPAEGQPEG